MLNEQLPTPRRVVAIKTKSCEDCGAPINWTYRAAEVCHPCRLSRRRAAYQPTGKDRQQPNCPDCGSAGIAKFSKGRWYTKRCEPCAFVALRRRQRNSMAGVRRRAGVVPVKGTTIACNICGTECVRNGISRKHCDTCGPQLWRVSLHKALNLRMGNRIRAGLASGSKRKRRWESIVGYTLADLMFHLERQFSAGMTWDNRGEWHIDHIRPLCSFNFDTPDDPQFREAWALPNLRPLWARDNLRKSGRRVLLI